MSKTPLTLTQRADLAAGRLLSYADVATFVGISLRTCKRWVAEGVLPAPDLRIRGIVRWRPSTIERWVDRQGKMRN